MARVKIQEYKAKQLLYKDLNIKSKIFQYDCLTKEFNPNDLDIDKTYVVKVDQGIKGRFKQGLVALDKKPQEIKEILEGFKEKGYSSFFIEELIAHQNSQEYFLSIERVRGGKKILYSKSGGVDIEKNKDFIEQIILNDGKDIDTVSKFLNTDVETIINLFDKYYFSFLEINPLVIIGQAINILDLAVEVDSTAEFFVLDGWDSADFVSDIKAKTTEEKEILKLSSKSQAAFKLDVLNPNGSVFMLLSGGGASIVLADEVQAQGFADMLADYGEYSGNPNEEETYIYTKNLLSLLIKSKVNKKVLIVGGGVANFTDISVTFKGVIRAMDEVSKEMERQKVKVFVRRGGPNQEKGLKNIKEFLKYKNILGNVSGPEMVLTDIVTDALNYLKK